MNALPSPYYQSEDGGVTLYHGDCREILPLLGKFDLLLTDPPYGINYDSRGGNGLHWRKQYATPKIQGDDKPFDPSFLWQYGSRQIVWGADHFRNQLPSTGRFLVWQKESRSNDNLKFADAEMAWDTTGTLCRAIYHRQNGFLNDGYGNGEPRQHPTQKPLNVMLWCLSIANDAQSIVDPFCGSGTTLVAAKQLGRRAIGIEIDERYCEIAVQRLAQGCLELAD